MRAGRTDGRTCCALRRCLAFPPYVLVVDIDVVVVLFLVVIVAVLIALTPTPVVAINRLGIVFWCGLVARRFPSR